MSICIVFVLFSGMTFVTTGCYAAHEAVIPHEIVYTSHIPDEYIDIVYQDPRYYHYGDFYNNRYHRYHRHHQRRYRGQHHHRDHQRRYRVQRHHRSHYNRHHRSQRPKLRKRVIRRHYNNKGKLRKRVIRRHYR